MKWFKRKNKSVNPIDLDWGIVTADFYDKKENMYIHIFNSDLSSEKNKEIVKYFCFNKFNYYLKHLPQNSKQKFLFDARGQNLNIDKLDIFKKELSNLIKNENLLIDFFV